MATLTINPEYQDQRISVASGMKAVKDHTPDELSTLAIMARKSNNPALVRCFVDLPSLADLTDDKIGKEQASIAEPVSTGTKAKKSTPISDPPIV